MFVLTTFVAFTAYSFGGFQGEAFGKVAFGAVADLLTLSPTTSVNLRHTPPLILALCVAHTYAWVGGLAWRQLKT